jgi:alginate O-acetyltransferase complex protein AlgJ
MMRHYRRYWFVAAAFLLAAPLLAGIVAPSGEAVSQNEARMLAPAPGFPHSLAEWIGAPRQIDAYLRDHFGLRPVFLRAYGLIMNRALKNAGNPLVLMGSDGWMFLRANGMVQQSAGLVRHDDQIAAVADLLATIRELLAVRGIRLLVASPPNSATIYWDRLPLWAQSRGQRTEYDVLLDDLAERGVAHVDLRPPLFAAKASGKVYWEHDTHWTPYGELAAFNAIAQADSHPDWMLNAASVLSPPTQITGGDLARILGVEADVTEASQALALPAAERELFGTELYGPYLATNGRSGPSIMVIGDSFTVDLFVRMLLQHTGHVVWLHHQSCQFDWKWIERFHPDEVWWMPTERLIPCQIGNRPAGLPAAKEDGPEGRLR